MLIVLLPWGLGIRAGLARVRVIVRVRVRIIVEVRVVVRVRVVVELGVFFFETSPVSGLKPR